jgi:hypothetical protein
VPLLPLPSVKNDINVIFQITPPPISPKLAEELAGIPATAIFRERYGRFVDPLHAFAEDFRILGRDFHARNFKWFSRAGKLARGFAKVVPALGKIVALGFVTLACAQTVEAYEKEGRFGPRTWRQLGEGAVDLTSLVSPDVTGYSEDWLSRYVRGKIAALQKKGYLGGSLINEPAKSWRHYLPSDFKPERPIFERPFELPLALTHRAPPVYLPAIGERLLR